MKDPEKLVKSSAPLLFTRKLAQSITNTFPAVTVPE
jgi:hypothetical protein